MTATMPDKIWAAPAIVKNATGTPDGNWTDGPAVGFFEYTRTDLSDASHQAGYELARQQAAKLGAFIVAYDVALKGVRG